MGMHRCMFVVATLSVMAVVVYLKRTRRELKLLIEKQKVKLHALLVERQKPDAVSCAALERRLEERLDKLEQRLATVQRATLEQLTSATCEPEVASEDTRWLSSATAAPPASATAELVQLVRAAPSAGAEGSLFALLPAEALQRVLCALDAPHLVICERVSVEWRQSVASLPFWRAWRTRGGVLSESAFVLPGTVAFAFGSSPAEIGADVREAAGRAAATAASLPRARVHIALCGNQWTVLSMTAGSEVPTALRQHQARDFLMACSAADELIFSGDKEAQLVSGGLLRTGADCP